MHRCQMGLSLSKRAQSSVPNDPTTTSTPDTTCSKEDQDAWHGMITRLEMDMAEETNGPYRHNLQACLDWIKNYG